MAYSRKVIQNGYEKKFGAAIYLRIIINRNKKLLSLKLDWPSKYFDKEAGLVKPRYKDDPDAHDYNMIITDSIAKANEIFKYFRLTKTELTIQKFVREFNTDLSKDDFLKYYSIKAKERLKDREIVQATYNDHVSTYNKLKLFSDTILFADMDEDWAWRFEAFLKRNIKSKGDTTNDRWKHHKNARTYINLARKKDHIKLIYPYDYFNAKEIPGGWDALCEDDVRKLWQFYTDKTNKVNLRRAVERFLFMCYTGLRVSDLDRVETNWLDQKAMLKFIPHKNRRFGKKLSIPLSKHALILWSNAAQNSNNQKQIFKHFAEQTSNEYLKIVANQLEIKTNIHHHIGRHTFITLFLKNGGPLDMASEYAGHTTIQQTMTYNHPDEERRSEAINVLDAINGDPSD